MGTEPKEVRIIDLKSIIGIWPLCNTGAVLIHQIDYGEDKVLASINGIEPEWCSMTEYDFYDTGEQEPGFFLGSLFCPFCEIQRFFGGAE